MKGKPGTETQGAGTKAEGKLEEAASLPGAEKLPPVVDAVRKMPFVAARSIAVTPKGYAEFPREVTAVLQKVAADKESEAKDVLREAVAKGADLGTILGKHAPDPALATALLAVFDDAVEARRKADLYAAYVANKMMVLENDVALFIAALKREVLHEAEHNADVVQEFPALMKYTGQVGSAISEGLAASPKMAARKKGATPSEATAPAGGETTKPNE